MLTIGAILWVCSLHAQQWKGLSIEPMVHIGKIYKHTPSLNFDPKDLGYSYGLEFNFKSKKYGRKPWHQHHNYPITGVDVFIYHIGEKEVFGNAVGVFPNVSFYIIQKQNWNFLFQLGGGVAYLSTHFHPVTNTVNNAIGSNLNNITNFKFQFDFRLHPKWTLNSGLSFTHFSNGATQLPNLGINIPSLAIGFKYTPSPLVKEDFISHEQEPLVNRFGINSYVGIAYREHIVSGGPRYPTHIASLAGTFLISPVNRLIAGIEFEFNRSVYVFGLETFSFNSEAEARKRSSRWMFFVADELLFGNIGLLGQIGVYLPTNPFLTGGTIYNKLAIRYYFPAIPKSGIRFHAGIYLKSHKTVAEYFGIGIGAAFSRMKRLK